MRVRIELEDGTIITIERPGRGRVGVRALTTEEDAEPGSPAALELSGDGDVAGAAAGENAGPGPAGTARREVAFAVTEEPAEPPADQVIDAGAAPGAGNRQEILFTQPAPPKRRSKKK